MDEFDWIGTLVNWFPMLLLIGVWVWFLKSGAFGKRQKESMDLWRRQIDILERIAVALEKR